MPALSICVVVSCSACCTQLRIHFVCLSVGRFVRLQRDNLKEIARLRYKLEIAEIDENSEEAEELQLELEDADNTRMELELNLARLRNSDQRSGHEDEDGIDESLAGRDDMFDPAAEVVMKVLASKQQAIDNLTKNILFLFHEFI